MAGVMWTANILLILRQRKRLFLLDAIPFLPCCHPTRASSSEYPLLCRSFEGSQQSFLYACPYDLMRLGLEQEGVLLPQELEHKG